MGKNKRKRSNKSYTTSKAKHEHTLEKDDTLPTQEVQQKVEDGDPKNKSKDEELTNDASKEDDTITVTMDDNFQQNDITTIATRVESNLGICTSLQQCVPHNSSDKNKNNTSESVIPEPLHLQCLHDNDNDKTSQGDTHDGKTYQNVLFHLAQNTLKRKEKSEKETSTTSMTTLSPTPIQLQSWSIYMNHHSQTLKTINNTEDNNRDRPLNLIGIAPTGSGKTYCYSIPMIASLLLHHSHHSKVKKINKGDASSIPSSSVYGVIMVPTRELSQQVTKEVQKILVAGAASYMKQEKLRKSMTIGAMAMYGGISKQEQIDMLLSSSDPSSLLSSTLEKKSKKMKKKKKREMNKKKYWIVVATPGRLLDIVSPSSTTNNDEDADKEQEEDNMEVNEKIKVIFGSIQSLVIDEADRMAGNKDMANQVEQIITTVSSFRNTGHDSVEKENMRYISLYSATAPNKTWSKWNEWANGPRFLIEVDAVTVGGNNRGVKEQNVLKGEEEEDSKSKSSDETSAAGVTSNKRGRGREENNGGEEDNKDESKRLNLSAIPKHVTQTLHVCANHKKPKKLLKTLAMIRKQDQIAATTSSSSSRNKNKSLIIIFFGRIKTLFYINSFLEKELSNSNMKSQIGHLHSQMNQERRDTMLLNFRSGKTPILLATDIAARGLHVNNVMYVINYDFPSNLEQYVHRCGRVGRNYKAAVPDDPNKKDNSKKSGHPLTTSITPTVYSYFNRELAPMARDVIELLESCGSWIDKNLRDLLVAGDGKGKTNKNEGGEDTRTKKRRRRGGNDNKEHLKSDGDNKTASKGRDNEEEDDEFASLNVNRIVLQRASHVSDAESDSNDED